MASLHEHKAGKRTALGHRTKVHNRQKQLQDLMEILTAYKLVCLPVLVFLIQLREVSLLLLVDSETIF